jgi:hypothetical protein
MLKALGRDLGAMTTWSAVDAERHCAPPELLDRTRPDKSTRYLPIYESVLDGSKPIRMLEIGSFYSDPLKKWQQYLHHDSQLVSVDVKSRLLKIAQSEGTHVRLADEHDGCLLSEIASEYGPFDVILDSGNHTSSQMVDSFRCLFANALCDNGIYIVEDVDRDYRKAFRDSHSSFIDFVRALIDAMPSHYRALTSKGKFQGKHPHQPSDGPVLAITPMLGAIEIYDSLVIVRRASPAVTRGLALTNNP